MAVVNVSLLLVLLYFGQGLPYGFQVKLLPLLLRKQSFSLSKVGLSRLLSLPWIFKFTVAPLVDSLWALPSWIISGSLAMSVLCFISAFVGVSNIYVLLLCVVLMNLISAVQDVAVDSFAITFLKPSELGRGSTFQVVGYKVGALCGGGLLSWLSSSFGWQWVFFLWGFFYVIILTLLLFNSQCYSQHRKRKEVSYTDNSARTSDKVASDGIIKNKEAIYKEGTNQSGMQTSFSDIKTGNLAYTQIMRNIIKTPGFLWLFKFVLIYKLGEQGVVSMLPLFMIDQGIPHDQVVTMSAIFGQLCSIAGSVIGGWIISMHCGQRSWVITVLRCVSCARLLPLAVIWLLSQISLNKYFAVLLECLLQFTGGIITTTTFALMMLSAQNSSEGTKASHSAVLATAEVLGKLTMISLSGILVDIVGYQCFFGLCFVLALLVVPVLMANISTPNKKSS